MMMTMMDEYTIVDDIIDYNNNCDGGDEDDKEMDAKGAKAFMTNHENDKKRRLVKITPTRGGQEWELVAREAKATSVWDPSPCKGISLSLQRYSMLFVLFFCRAKQCTKSVAEFNFFLLYPATSHRWNHCLLPTLAEGSPTFLDRGVTLVQGIRAECALGNTRTYK